MTEAVEGEVHSFVAGEFSNMIWGFYLLKYFGSKNNKLRLKTMYNSIKSDDKIIEDELKSLLNTSDNASGLLAQRVYDFNSSSGTKVQHFLEFSKDF
ncbi:hypothetical protein [Capnocytophaga granulosa]